MILPGILNILFLDKLVHTGASGVDACIHPLIQKLLITIVMGAQSSTNESQLQLVDPITNRIYSELLFPGVIASDFGCLVCETTTTRPTLTPLPTAREINYSINFQDFYANCII